MRRGFVIGIIAALIAIALIVSCRLCHKRPPDARQKAVSFLQNVQSDLARNDVASFLKKIAVPASFQSRTEAEQADFVAKALRDEISPSGVDALLRNGEFGAASVLFPDQAANWASTAGVSIQDCVAFKASKNGIYAEVVIATNAGGYRLVRLNNVKQME